MQLNRLFEYLQGMDAAFKIPDAMYGFTIPSFLGVQAGQALNDLTVCVQVFYDFNPPEKMNITVGLKKIGFPMDDEGLSYKTRAGWFNANPVILCVPDLESNFPAKGSFMAVAFAKEGLINQKTASKAIGRLETSLKRQGLIFNTKIIVPLTRLDCVQL